MTPTRGKFLAMLSRSTTRSCSARDRRAFSALLEALTASFAVMRVMRLVVYTDVKRKQLLCVEQSLYSASEK